MCKPLTRVPKTPGILQQSARGAEPVCFATSHKALFHMKPRASPELSAGKTLLTFSFFKNKFTHPESSIFHTYVAVDTIQREASICVPRLPLSLGERQDLLHKRSRRLCRCGLPRIKHAVVRMRQGGSRLDCRAMQRSPESRTGLQREPTLVDRNTVTTTKDQSVSHEVHKCRGHQLQWVDSRRTSQEIPRCMLTKCSQGHLDPRRGHPQEGL